MLRVLRQAVSWHRLCRPPVAPLRPDTGALPVALVLTRKPKEAALQLRRPLGLPAGLLPGLRLLTDLAPVGLLLSQEQGRVQALLIRQEGDLAVASTAVRVRRQVRGAVRLRQ
jgi:hypothetical protein